jgi:hypothetical protein
MPANPLHFDPTSLARWAAHVGSCATEDAVLIQEG